MPTFREKCPEFGQKISIEIYGKFTCQLYIGYDHTCNEYVIATGKGQVRRMKYHDEWHPAPDKEPQWTQITEDESTWPEEHSVVVVDFCDCETIEHFSHEFTWWTRNRNEKLFQISDGEHRKFPNEAIGMEWTHIPTRKKEEKTHLGDGSIEQLKREETEARLLKLERKADEFDDFIRSQKRKESSPWKCAINNPPPFGKLVFVRMKQNNGEFGYCISGRYDILRWHHDPLNRENGFKDEEDFVGEWMEIPK